MSGMININISISVEDLAYLIAEHIPSTKIFCTDSIYQILTEYPNEVSAMAKQFNISRNLMMEVVFDHDEQITKQLFR